MVRKIEFWLIIPAITNIWQIGIDYTTIYISTSMKNEETRSMADDSKLMNELRINDEKLNKEMYEQLLDPTTVLNILMEKLQMYSRIESSLTDPVNMLILNSMKAGVANQIMITQIKSDMDEQLVQINRRIDALEEKINNLHESS